MRPRHRRRRRRRHGPRPAPSDAPRLGSAVEGGDAAPEGEAASGENIGVGEGPSRPVLKLRNFRRRRRRLAHPPGLRSGGDEPAPSGGETPSTGETAAAEAPDGTPATDSETAAQPERPPGQPRRRRRRRRGPRPEGAPGAPEAAGGDAAAAAPGEQRPPRRDRFVRDRRPQREGEPDGAGNRERRDRDRQGAGGGERRDRRGDRGDRRGGRRDDRRGGPGGRGRDAPRRVERKLYSVDSVVDRGFEDVEAEGESRRVHWTIVKRTVADQISRKAVSASYVLQRDGAGTEFPSLGAARDAVNKTIVHPEKLTPSKSEIAALKGNSR